MFETREISAAEAAKVIAATEGRFSDVKDIRIKPAKLSHTESAFANASGGEIFLGEPLAWAVFRKEGLVLGAGACGMLASSTASAC